MGERKKRVLRVGFDRSVKLEFHGAKISSYAGLMLHRELDEVLGLTRKAATIVGLDMTRLMSETIHTKSNSTGKVRPGNEECSNQTHQGSPGRLGHKGNRARMTVWA